jgi:ribosomal-protein-alanine N-acetyltransferase
VIRHAEAGDLDPIAEIERHSHPHPWSRASFESELANPFFLVIGRPAEAYLVCWLVAGELQVQNITTAPDHRRKGHARALLEHVLALVGVATLEVREHNTAAIALYEALGFKLTGRRPGFYSNGDAALLMNR